MHLIFLRAGDERVVYVAVATIWQVFFDQQLLFFFNYSRHEVKALIQYFNFLQWLSPMVCTNNKRVQAICSAPYKVLFLGAVALLICVIAFL